MKLFAYIAFFFFGVFSASAQTVTDTESFARFILATFNTLIPILIGLGLLFFLWGVVKYIGAADDAEQRKESRAFMLNGVIFLFVMLSVWGLVGLISNTLNLDNSTIPTTPNLLTP